MGFCTVWRNGRNGNKCTHPCRCGHLDEPALACSRAPRCALDYQSKISGPPFDRIDLHVAEALTYRRIAPGRG